jgi:Ca2+-binding EF-hand superfamily protein
MRKRGTIENQDLQKEVRDRFGLPQQEVSEIASKFQRYDSLKTGYIGKHELDDVMRGTHILQP